MPNPVDTVAGSMALVVTPAAVDTDEKLTAPGACDLGYTTLTSGWALHAHASSCTSVIHTDEVTSPLSETLYNLGRHTSRGQHRTVPLITHAVNRAYEPVTGFDSWGRDRRGVI
jgi:hypothetical protein